MNILLISALIIISVIYLFRSKSTKVIYMRKLMLPVALSCFLLCLIVFSGTAVDSAKKGLELWFNIVFPSLFPFFVISELLNATGFVRAAGVLVEPLMRPLFNVPGCGSFALAMGVTSGYPVGAKITTDMRGQGLLTKIEAERLLAFTNNSGPLFIVGAVAVGMLQRPELGVFLLLCHIMAGISVGIIFRFYKSSRKYKSSFATERLLSKFKKELLIFKKNVNINFGQMLGSAISNSISTIFAIGGFIILFSVLINLLLVTGIIDSISVPLSSALGQWGIGKELISSVISGFFEITTGTNIASKASGTAYPLQLAAISLIIGWAGLSVHSQVISIVSKSDISIKPYLMGKLLQGIISAIYTYAGIKTAGLLSIQHKPAFSAFNISHKPSFGGCLAFAIESLAAVIMILILCTLVSIILLVFSKRKSAKELF